MCGNGGNLVNQGAVTPLLHQPSHVDCLPLLRNMITPEGLAQVLEGNVDYPPLLLIDTKNANMARTIHRWLQSTVPGQKGREALVFASMRNLALRLTQSSKIEPYSFTNT